MKFVCDQSVLSSHLATIGRVVPNRPSHPILANVLVTAEADRISLTGFDLSTGIQSSFSADVVAEGSTTIPYQLLSGIVSKLDGELTVSIDESQVTIKSRTGKFSIHHQDPEEYPPLPEINADAISLPIAILRDGLSRTVFAVSTEEAKQALCGVHVSITPGQIEFASTNGHHLSVATHAAETDQAVELTVPSKAVQALQQMINSTKEESIAIQLDQYQLVTQVGGQRLTSRLLEGQYPDYNRLIPKQFSKQVTIERSPFIKALERVGILADQKNSIVKIGFDSSQQEAIISVEAQDVGSAREVLSCQISGDDLEIAFNVKYLLDGLKAMDSTEISISLNSSTSPTVFQPIGPNKMTYLVMPVQIRA